jgi:hypothetical protein
MSDSTKTVKEEYLEIKAGDVLTFDVLQWDEGYEFGAPCLILSPVIRENSDSHPEAMIESVCIDAVLDGELLLNNEQQQIEWRQWNLKTLRRRFNEALAGKKFSKLNYRATRQKVRFFWDDEEDRLNWETLT